jgi:hypothetical protein
MPRLSSLAVAFSQNQRQGAHQPHQLTILSGIFTIASSRL